MNRRDIPKVLFSCVRDDDPYKTSKLLQIERWCYVNWNLHQRGGEKKHNLIAQVFSEEECWKKVNNLHGVKLNRQMVGKKLILPSDSVNPFSDTTRYKIACECCLEEDIRALFEERKKELLTQNKSSLLEYNHLIECFGEGALGMFWSHLVGDYVSKLNMKGRHIYEFGLDCAIDDLQVQAVEFFWNKIKCLPEDELSAPKKDEILMKNAVYTAGNHFNSCPDIFEFFLNQINPNKYPELLKRDLDINCYYGSLSKMQDTLNFDEFKKLFNYLKPEIVSEDSYYTWLIFISKEIQNYQECYANAAEELFLYIWTKEGFESHRTFVLYEEVLDSSSFFYKNLLIPWVEKGFMEPIWAVLDKLSSDEIKIFMNYKQANYIGSVLEQRDDNSLNRFLAYDQSIGEDLYQFQENIISSRGL